MLGILYEGATGNTRQEISEVLRFSKHSDISKIFSELRLSMSCKNNQTCSMMEANGIFPSITVDISSGLLDIVQGQMGAELLPMDYADETSAVTMNEWVSNKTSGLIKDMIQSNSAGPNTTLILINTIYIKASWKKPICMNATESQNFYLEKDQTISCPMMKQTSLLTNAG